jgi:hypothetical protein
MRIHSSLSRSISRTASPVAGNYLVGGVSPYDEYPYYQHFIPNMDYYMCSIFAAKVNTVGFPSFISSSLVFRFASTPKHDHRLYSTSLDKFSPAVVIDTPLFHTGWESAFGSSHHKAAPEISAPAAFTIDGSARVAVSLELTESEAKEYTLPSSGASGYTVSAWFSDYSRHRIDYLQHPAVFNVLIDPIRASIERSDQIHIELPPGTFRYSGETPAVTCTVSDISALVFSAASDVKVGSNGGKELSHLRMAFLSAFLDPETALTIRCQGDDVRIPTPDYFAEPKNIHLHITTTLGLPIASTLGGTGILVQEPSFVDLEPAAIMAAPAVNLGPTFVDELTISCDLDMEFSSVRSATVKYQFRGHARGVQVDTDAGDFVTVRLPTHVTTIDILDSGVSPCGLFVDDFESPTTFQYIPVLNPYPENFSPFYELHLSISDPAAALLWSRPILPHDQSVYELRCTLTRPDGDHKNYTDQSLQVAVMRAQPGYDYTSPAQHPYLHLLLEALHRLPHPAHDLLLRGARDDADVAVRGWIRRSGPELHGDSH